MPGVGFGMGMERLLLVMQAQNVEIEEPSRCDVFIHTFGDIERTFVLCMQLRKAGVKAEFDPLNRSTKAQMRYAEKLGATIVLFEGEEERKNRKVNLRRMSDGEQKEYDLAMAMEALEATFVAFNLSK